MYWHVIPVPFALFVINRYLLARMRNNLERVGVVQPLGTALIIGVVGPPPLRRGTAADRPLPVIFSWGVVGVGPGGAHTKYPAVRITLCDLL